MAGLFISDGHVDLIYDLERRGSQVRFAELKQGPVTPESLQKGPVTLLVCALYCEDRFNGPDTGLKRLMAR